MNVADLINALRNMPQDADIKVAGQPSYPMEVEFIGVAMANGKEQDSDDECERAGCFDARSNHPDGGACIAVDLDTDEPCTCEGWVSEDDEADAAVWLVVGDNIGYGVPREVFDEARYGF